MVVEHVPLVTQTGTDANLHGKSGSNVASTENAIDDSESAAQELSL